MKFEELDSIEYTNWLNKAETTQAVNPMLMTKSLEEIAKKLYENSLKSKTVKPTICF